MADAGQIDEYLNAADGPFRFCLRFPGCSKVNIPKVTGGNYVPGCGIYLDRSRDTRNRRSLLRMRMCNDHKSNKKAWQ